MHLIIKYSAIAGILLLGACGSGNNSSNFSTQTFTLPSDVQTKIIDAPQQGRNAIGRDYLKSISFNNADDGLIDTALIGSKQNGLFVIRLLNEIDSLNFISPRTPAVGGHIFVGMFPTTNVGDPLIANAVFNGSYYVYLLVAPDINSEFSSTGIHIGIKLNADFNEGTLTGTGSIPDRYDEIDTALKVNGRFSGESNTLSGSVSYTSAKISDRTFTAPLSGVIGQDGAVGVFTSHENTNDTTGYAFGGGFVVN